MPVVLRRSKRNVARVDYSKFFDFEECAPVKSSVAYTKSQPTVRRSARNVPRVDYSKFFDE